MTIWQALGEFLTSPGFGGLAALAAAGVAYLSVQRRIEADRDMAKEKRDDERADAARAEARQRWWEGWQWVWDNYRTRPPSAVMSVLAVLEHGAQTAEQNGMLAAVVDAIRAEESGSDDDDGTSS